MKNHQNQKPKNKIRLDDYLLSKGWFDTKSQAQGAIMSGKVKVNDEVITKSGTQIKLDKEPSIEVKSLPYVSRGGFKLEKAVKEFNIDLNGKICLDAGASTGGFTDFMLQNGAKKVYAVDVGYGQLAWKLRQDDKVVVVERTNIKNATSEEIYTDINSTENELFAEFCCIDVSFISVIKILNNIKQLMHPNRKEIALLVKPQFEAGKEQVPKSGVIKEANIHIQVIKNVIEFALSIGLYPVDLTYSPIQGPAGNIEFLLYIRPDCDKIDYEKLVLSTVEKAHEHFNKDNK